MRQDGDFRLNRMQRSFWHPNQPRRKQLLQWAEVPFDVIVADTDEHYPPSLGFEEIAIYIARNKALAVLKNTRAACPYSLLTPLLFAKENCWAKPTDDEDAIRMLSLLQGKTRSHNRRGDHPSRENWRSPKNVGSISHHDIRSTVILRR